MGEDLKNDEVFGDLFERKKQKKKKSTDVFITLNLNEVFATMSTERKHLFRSFGVKLFKEEDILLYFKDMTNPEYPLENMDKVEIKWKPEVGPKNGKLHLHALVAIEHHGFYTFQANELREHARQVFGHSVYLQCPVSSNARTRWNNYIHKGLQ
jgi:hypothetical protein